MWHVGAVESPIRSGFCTMRPEGKRKRVPTKEARAMSFVGSKPRSSMSGKGKARKEGTHRSFQIDFRGFLGVSHRPPQRVVRRELDRKSPSTATVRRQPKRTPSWPKPARLWLHPPLLRIATRLYRVARRRGMCTQPRLGLERDKKLPLWPSSLHRRAKRPHLCPPLLAQVLNRLPRRSRGPP